MSVLQGYRLSLADGQTWQIMAGQADTCPWVDQMAAVMRLRIGEANEWPSLIVTRSAEGRDDSFPYAVSAAIRHRLSLPSRGWKERPGRWVRFFAHDESPHILCDLGHTTDPGALFLQMSCTLFPVHVVAQQRGGIPFHAALIEKKGRAILLGAPGGTGKSTCSRRLDGGWECLGDDEALIVRTAPGRYRVHPFPTWSDYMTGRAAPTWPVERSIPLAAVCFLEQSAVDELVALGQGEAAFAAYRLAGQIFQKFQTHLANHEAQLARRQLFQNVADLVQSIPCFVLRVSLRGRFWTCLDRVVDSHLPLVPGEGIAGSETTAKHRLTGM